MFSSAREGSLAMLCCSAWTRARRKFARLRLLDMSTEIGETSWTLLCLCARLVCIRMRVSAPAFEVAPTASLAPKLKSRRPSSSLLVSSGLIPCSFFHFL